MTAYKVPRIVRFLDALPKSTVGKILRRELRGRTTPEAPSALPLEGEPLADRRSRIRGSVAPAGASRSRPRSCGSVRRRCASAGRRATAACRCCCSTASAATSSCSRRSHAAMPGREVITFDVPGVGHSALPSRPYRLRYIARLAAALLDRYGHAQADVLGVSWGGAAAQQFARTFASRCRRLILCATAPGIVMVPARPPVLLKMATPRRYISSDYSRSISGDIYGGDFRQRSRSWPTHLQACAVAIASGLLPAARRRLGLDQHSLAAPAAPAHADHGRARRPAGAAGQREADARC